MTDQSPDQFAELIPGLPEDIALECLTRLHYSAQGIALGVCKRWLRLLRSREFYHHRKSSGQTRKVACLVQALPSPPLPSESKKSAGPPSYGITVYDPISGAWDRIDPIPKYPDGLPLFCQVASTEGKLFVLGGWDPSSWEPVRDVFKYEFTTGRWTQCADMATTRSFFAVGAADGRIFIAGGHDESKNALSSAWVFDVERNEWTELPRMKEERDECEGVVIGSEFWVVSGYDTENQGGFKSSADFFEPSTGEWTRVEDAWRGTQCPRSCVCVSAAENGQLTSWAECDSAVRVGTCGIDLGEVALVTGSPYQSAAHGLFLVDKNATGSEKAGGQNGKLMKVELPEPFSGFVQSGCFAEI